jgi:hypothetical protein
VQYPLSLFELKTTRNKSTFCQSTACGNITSCKKPKGLGHRIRELSDFKTNDLALEHARHDVIKLQRLVTANNSIVDDLPTSTKWLVLHCLYNLNATATSATTTEARLPWKSHASETWGMSWKALRPMLLSLIP